MTHLDLYTNALIEQNKLEAPPLLIEEYNYLINKAIIQYSNLVYARFDLNQQSSDDLRWLQRSVELDVARLTKLIPPMEEANYACVLPSDYFHMLNCTVHFSRKCEGADKSSKCKPANDDSLGGVFSLCRRLTANQFPAIIQNAYLKPTYKRPYYYINTSKDGGKLTAALEEKGILNPCDTIESGCIVPEWKNDIYQILHPCSEGEQNCTSGKIMEIRCGINPGWAPDVVYVDYLKVPELIELTWDDVRSVEDNTKECEFPDAVAYEIINIFTKLLLENAGDERLKTHFAINQTVGGIPESKGK